MRDSLLRGQENWGSLCRLILPPPILIPNNYLCCNYPIQQIRASDIWRESEHEGLLDYYLKIKMKGTEFDPPTIKFKGSTDDSQLDIHLRIDYKSMNEFVQIIITCAHLFVDN